MNPGSYARCAIWAAGILSGVIAPAGAQTTQSLIAGRAIDRSTNLAIAGVRVRCVGVDGNPAGEALTDFRGFYTLPLISPGTYRLVAEKAGYQAYLVEQVELAVASRLSADVTLRPLDDVWGEKSRQYVYSRDERVVNFYATDLEKVQPTDVSIHTFESGTLYTGQSYVVDSRELAQLPLAGRDVYSMLAYLPGVTADTAGARGLALSANGQRPSASNFLLDGVEFNNYLVTGNLIPMTPDTVQEYRVSISNFSAEYGRTSGYLANAVTKAGGSSWHGRAYFYLKNDALNANDFQRNLNPNQPRLPLKEAQPGFTMSGPLVRDRLFVSGTFEYLRFRRVNDPEKTKLPSRQFLESTPQDSIARKLLQPYALPNATKGANHPVEVFVPDVDSLNRYLLVPRLDWNSPGGKHRTMLRLAAARVQQPGFIFSPYPDYSSPLEQHTAAPALAWLWTPGAALNNEFRAGFTFDDLHFDRAHPEIPLLRSDDEAILPGSPAFLSFRNRNRSLELSDNLMMLSGRHAWKAGGGALLRKIDGYLAAGREPVLDFTDLAAFRADQPSFLIAGFARQDLPVLRTPDYNREYRSASFYLFTQDSFRATSRLFLNYGVRYDHFGSPKNVGPAKDAVVQLGAGSNLGEALSSADTRIVYPQSGDQQLYAGDGNDWAGRAGLALRIRRDGTSLVRAAGGVFYDRPFDNLWQTLRNNSVVVEVAGPGFGCSNYRVPVEALIPCFSGSTDKQSFPPLTVYQPGIRTPYAINWSAGYQQQIGSSTTVEANVFGSRGRKLITTDLVNRLQSVGPNPFNPVLNDLQYRGNQGSSDYRALTLVARHRTSRVLLQVSYTWSRLLDNQSEPLAGDYFNLQFTSKASAVSTSGFGTFSRQFDSRADWGYSDFDQHHNLVSFSAWQLPAPSRGIARMLLRDWTIAHVAAFRSGFPYTVRVTDLTPDRGEVIRNNRANLISPGGYSVNAYIPGGKLLLNSAAFGFPAPGTLGETQRNQFHGPGLISLDLSLSRSIPLKWAGERGRLTVRADAFNFLNHANLNNPQSFLLPSSSPLFADFGKALYGREGRNLGFLTLAPFDESARQVQFLISLQF